MDKTQAEKPLMAHAAASAVETPPAVLAPDTFVAALDKAREEERAKFAAMIKKSEEAAKQAAERAAAAEQERLAFSERVKQLELANNEKLTPNEKMRQQLEEMQARIAAEREARQQELAAMNAQLHNERMEAYRNRRLAEVGVSNLIPAFVSGNTPEEIEQSIQFAQSEYQRLRQQHLSEFQQQFGAAPQGQGATNTVPSVVAATPSEHFSPQRAGLPSGYAPPVAAQPQTPQIHQLTSEQAVRSGQYARHRDQLFAELVGQSQPGQSLILGNKPRQYATVSTNAVQPQGLPSTPAPPVYQQAAQPQVFPSNAALLGARTQQPQPPQQYVQAPVQQAAPASELELARAAIERTNAGQNQLVQAQAHLVGRIPDGGGQVRGGTADNARAAYEARFQHTPPVAQA